MKRFSPDWAKGLRQCFISHCRGCSECCLCIDPLLYNSLHGSEHFEVLVISSRTTNYSSSPWKWHWPYFLFYFLTTSEEAGKTAGSPIWRGPPVWSTLRPPRGSYARKRIRKLKERQGIARNVMVIGSTGFRTFVDPKGELHHVIQNCREAKITTPQPTQRGRYCAGKKYP